MRKLDPASRAAQVTVPVHGSPELAALEACEVLSLDVFDTAIHRCVDRPTSVFGLAAAALLNERLTEREIHHLGKFPEQRVAAEATARDRKQASAGTREVHLDEIYAVLEEQLGAEHAPLLERLRLAELEVEEHVTYADPFVLGLAREAQARRKRVVFCSDMYLGAETISALLQAAGYSGFQHVFVSSELGVSKHQGTMFPMVREKLQVPAEKILHIGDSAQADVEGAQLAGWNAIHRPYLQPAETGAPPLLPGASQRANPDRVVRALVGGLQRRGELVLGEALQDPWVHLGYRVFGPLLTGHALWLAHSLQALRPEKALFLARDAFLMLELYKPLADRLGLSLPCEYVFASRGSLLLDSFTDFQLDRLWSLFAGRAGRSLGTTMRNLGLLPERHRDALQRAGFSSEEEPLERNDPRMFRLLCSLHASLLDVAKERRALSGEYLRGIAGQARHLAVVDVGWMGNMQSSLLRLLGPDHNQFRLDGLYVGLSKEVKGNRYPGHGMHAWLWQDGLPESRCAAFWGGGVALLEFALCAPHGSTLGYRRSSDGRVEPVLERNERESDYLRSADALHKGVRLFFQSFLDITGGVATAALLTDRWADEFFRLVLAPTEQEAEILGSLTHSDGVGDTRARLPIVEKLPPDTERAQVEQGLVRSFWRYGFRVRNADLIARHGLSLD